MSRERRRLIGAALVLVLLGIGGWLLLGNRGTSPSTKETASPPGETSGGASPAGAAAARPRRAASAEVTTIPIWLTQPDIPERRIAGQVLLDGKPLAGAEVRLGTWALMGTLATARTDAEGRFDFGVRPGINHLVAAIWPGRPPALKWTNPANAAGKPMSDQLVLELRACKGTVSGQVRDASGGPIAGAWLRLWGLVGTQTGADGSYELCVAAGGTELRVDAAGYGSVILFFPDGGRIKRDIILVPEGSLEGRVVTADTGEAVPGAYVVAYPFEFGRERAAPAFTFADERGEFRLDGLQSGRYRLSARGAALGMNDSLQVMVVAGETSGGNILKLTPQAQIAGIVVEAGKPVPGAYVQAIGMTAQLYSGMALTQADGSFTLDMVTPGAVRFNVTGYRVKSPAQAEVPAAGLRGVKVELTAMGTLRGKVMRGGKPVPRASVRAATAQAISEADGSYELRGLTAGESSIYAQSEEVGAFTQQTVRLAEGELREGFDLELDSGATISGTVVDEAGQPLAGLHVVWTHTKTGDVGIGTTDENGAFVCDAMTGKGSYAVKVFATAESSAPLPPAGAAHPAVELADGQARVDGVRLAVRNERETIAGHVVDGAGAPIPDARVVALSVKPGAEPVFSTWVSLPEAKADAEGAFAIGDLPSGSYALRAYAPGGAEGTVRNVMSGTSGVFLTVSRTATIRGRLVGYTATSVPVYIVQTDGSSKFFPAIVEGATFRAEGVTPGRYLVAAQTLHEGDAKLVEVRGGVPSELVMESKGSGTLEGTVTEQTTGAPVAGLRCHTVLRAGGFLAVTNWDTSGTPMTDAQGRFTNPAAPAGDFQVTCFSNGSYSGGQAWGTLARGGKASVRMKVVRMAEGSGERTTGAVIEISQVEPRISRIEPGSAAARADVRPGDLVVSVDGAPIDGLGPAGVVTLIRNHPVGSTVVLGLSRGGQALSVSLAVSQDD